MWRSRNVAWLNFHFFSFFRQYNYFSFYSFLQIHILRYILLTRQLAAALMHLQDTCKYLDVISTKFNSYPRH